MSQDMWQRDPLGRKRGAALRRGLDMFGEDVLETDARERSTARADEDLRRRHSPTHPDPRAQGQKGDFPQGQRGSHRPLPCTSMLAVG